MNLCPHEILVRIQPRSYPTGLVFLHFYNPKEAPSPHSRSWWGSKCYPCSQPLDSRNSWFHLGNYRDPKQSNHSHHGPEDQTHNMSFGKEKVSHDLVPGAWEHRAGQGALMISHMTVGNYVPRERNGKACQADPTNRLWQLQATG